MAMAADLARGQQQQQPPMDLRRALQDGRAVLAGGPGLGSQMILLRNDPIPPPMAMAPQQQQQHHHHQHHVQQQVKNNAATQEFNYPMQGFAAQHEDPNRHISTEVGAPGSISQEQNAAANPSMAPALQSYATSNVSSGLGFHNMEYAHPGGPVSESFMQSYPGLASNYEASVHTGATQQSFIQQGYGIGMSTEMAMNPQGSVSQESLASGFPTAAAGTMSHFQGSSSEDNRRLAMIHEYGNESFSHSEHQTSHYQPQYHHPVSLDQPSSHPPTNLWAQQISLQQQRIREIELQHIWRRQLEIDLQRRQYQQLKHEEQNLRQRSVNSAGKMRKTKTSSRYFQKPVMKKKTRLPPLAGPEGPGWCNICQTDCNTSEMLQYHVAGKKHKKKLQQLGKEGKDAVEKSSPAENLRQVSKNDKDATIVIESNSKFSLKDVTSAEKAGSGLGSRKLDNANIEEPSVEPPAKRPHLLEDPQSIQKLLLTERCDICNIACNTKMVLESHFKGKKHAAKVKKLADGAQFRKTGSHLKVQRNEIKEETVGKELNSGFVRDTGKGMNDNLTEDQCTKLKDIAVCLDGSTTSVRRDDDVIGNSDPQPGTEELASEKSKEH